MAFGIALKNRKRGGAAKAKRATGIVGVTGGLKMEVGPVTRATLLKKGSRTRTKECSVMKNIAVSAISIKVGPITVLYRNAPANFKLGRICQGAKRGPNESRD